MKTLIPFAVLAALLPLASVSAAPPLETKVVSYRDLDLRSAPGRAALDRRIHRAAQTVCGTASDFDLVGQRNVRRCQTATAANALARVIDKDRSVQVAVAGR